MTTIPAAPPKEGFRLSQLIYDTRYRSMTIQIVALIALLTFFGWLINNTAQNLAALGKPVEFSFLQDPASYDINQRPVEYNSRDTHLRASFVGLLNTMIVAILGCITATIIGVSVGVARLSKNWLVARLMTGYVEMFRNIPVLVWILIIFSIFIDTMPAPRDFKGEDPTASMIFGETVAASNRGVYTPVPVFENSLGAIHFFGESSLRFDLSLNFLAIVAVLVGSFLAARAHNNRATQNSK